MMASLKKKIILSFAASLAIFLIFVSAILFSGLNIALKGWYRASENRYSNSIVKTLEKVYSRTENPAAEEIRKELGALLGERFSLLIVSADGKIILSHNIKRPLMPQPQGMGLNRRSMEGMMAPPPGFRPEMMPDFMHNITPVLVNSTPAAFVWVRSTRFETADSLNRQLMRSVFFTLFIGLTLSIAAAILSTTIISGKITKEASRVSGGLEKIASGSRDVLFPDGSSNEISSISRSALILQEKLLKEENARKQWTQDIAHDLRTPTTAVKAQLEAMIDGVLKPEKSRLEKLLAETNRLEMLIEDINRLTIIESGGVDFSRQDISSGELAEIIQERFAILAQEKNINLVIENSMFTLHGDINHLTRAISNLVQNSIQYSPAGSVIKIDFTSEGNSGVITVENSGYIPENELEKIFDRLYRGEYGRSAKGSGLGLTIAKAAIEKHNGTITAENRKRGDENRVAFTVKIPLHFLPSDIRKDV